MSVICLPAWLSVRIWKPCFPVDSIFLVKELISDIGIPQLFFAFWNIFGFWVFSNQRPVHNGGVSRGKVCGFGCWRKWLVTGDRWQVKRYTWHVTCANWHMTCANWHVTHDTSIVLFFGFSPFSFNFLYQCYCPLALRDSLSPVHCICLMFLPSEPKYALNLSLYLLAIMLWKQGLTRNKPWPISSHFKPFPVNPSHYITIS